ncbi:MAG TPA: YcxB family protein [Bacteroidales bacterium]|nr:YcxB family protein [Bacteroidales bacterium]
MTLTYPLNHNDFLTYQLYNTTRSKENQKRRSKSRTRIALSYFLVALLAYLAVDSVLAMMFIVMGIISYLFLPYYIKHRTYNAMSRFVQEQFHNKFGKSGTVEFGDKLITATDDFSELKIKLEGFSEINEIKNYFFFKTTLGESLIVPKSSIIDKEKFDAYIETLKRDFGIKHNIDLDWKWK